MILWDLNCWSTNGTATGRHTSLALRRRHHRRPSSAPLPSARQPFQTNRFVAVARRAVAAAPRPTQLDGSLVYMTIRTLLPLTRCKGGRENGRTANRVHQNVNVSHYDGEMTFLGTPNRPSVSHHSWRTCRPMEPKADMCDAGGTAVLTPSMLTAVARRSKVTEAEDKSPRHKGLRGSNRLGNFFVRL